MKKVRKLTPKMLKKPVRAVRHASKVKGKAKARVAPIPINRIKRDGFTGYAGEYDRRVYVRFNTGDKELVKKAAADSGLSPYIANFATEAARAGRELVATPATTKEAGVFARFASPSVKKMVVAAADKCGVSLSAYASYFAVEAARAGKKMAAAEKAAAAS
jgi:uncharacterized protein (DUF1778 family)